MNYFSNSDKYDMLECFILCRRNDAQAEESYLTKYPERRQPGRAMFRRLKDNLIAYGSFAKVKRNKPVDENKENLVLQSVVETPRTSLRHIEEITGVARSTSGSILKRRKYHPYRERPCQGLQDGDTIRRIAFCQWFIQKNNEIPNFFLQILWSDESRFTNCGLFNRKNTVYWSDVNPRLAREVRHQVRWGFNVWLGVLGTRMIGPYFFNENLNSARYLNLLQTNVAEELMDLPLAVLRQMFFQQDGAPPHNGQIITNYLNAEFHDRWIGNLGPVRWPARSPDLTPLDFFVWGHLKNQVYSRTYENVEELREAVTEAVNTITPQMIRQSCEAVLRRCMLCAQQNGEVFERLL